MKDKQLTDTRLIKISVIRASLVRMRTFHISQVALNDVIM